jgi:hypothetical protein
MLNAWLERKHPEVIVNSKIILPLEKSVLEEYFGEASKTSNNKLKTVSALNGYRNSVKSLYVDNRVDSSEFDEFVGEFLAGYRREIAKKKQIGEIKLTEGRAALAFQGYRLIAEKALSIEKDFNSMTFAHLFTLLTWNLMARSVSIANLKFCHISWDMDALVFTIPKQKNDQEGARSYPRHVYANSNDPSICPVLALGVKLFCSVYITEISQDQINVFPGRNEESRYSEWLQSFLKRLSPDDEMQLGAAIAEIGNVMGLHYMITFILYIPFPFIFYIH